MKENFHPSQVSFPAIDVKKKRSEKPIVTSKEPSFNNVPLCLPSRLPIKKKKKNVYLLG